jgi:hypothetical protein
MRYVSLLVLFFCALVIVVPAQKKHKKIVDKPKTSGQQSKIDAIATAADVETLLKTIDPVYEGFKVNTKLKCSEKEGQKIIKNQGVKPWTKVDLDNNGSTDLLINGWENNAPLVLCVVDSGQNHFSVLQVNGKSGQTCMFAVVTNTGKSKTIIAYYPEPVIRNTKQKGRSLLKTQLALHHGELLESTGSPANHHIEKIEYSTTMCYGRCPVFSLVINGDKSASFTGVKFNTKNGNFSTTIDDKSFDAIVDVLNFIDFTRLDDSYRVMHTDAQTATLKITYDGGKEKSIGDYGLRGTAGLTKLHALLFQLRDTQDWK